MSRIFIKIWNSFINPKRFAHSLYKPKTPSLILICIAVVLFGCGSREHSFVLSLPANPDSGFDWKVEQADELFEMTSQFEHNNSLDAAGGIQTFTMIPVETGFTNLTFTLKERNGNNEGASYSYSVIVDQKLGIEVVSMTGTLAGAKLSKSKIPEPIVK